MTHVWIVTYLHAGLYGTVRKIGGVFSTLTLAGAYMEALETERQGCATMVDMHAVDVYAIKPRST